MAVDIDLPAGKMELYGQSIFRYLTVPFVARFVISIVEINEVVSPVVSNDLVFLGWSQFVLVQPITIGQWLKMQGVIISRFTPHHPSWTGQ